MTTPAFRLPLAIRFSLDDYTDWYNSPHAAVLFWSVFSAVLLIIIAATLIFFRGRRRVRR